MVVQTVRYAVVLLARGTIKVTFRLLVFQNVGNPEHDRAKNNGLQGCRYFILFSVRVVPSVFLAHSLTIINVYIHFLARTCHFYY